MPKDAGKILTDLLAAHEGGAPPVTIVFDDATRNYVAIQAWEFRVGSEVDQGYGRGIVSALLDLMEAQTARREGRDKKWAEDT